MKYSFHIDIESVHLASTSDVDVTVWNRDLYYFFPW